MQDHNGLNTLAVRTYRVPLLFTLLMNAISLNDWVARLKYNGNPFIPNTYQKDLFDAVTNSRTVDVYVHRRTGNTTAMAVLALYYACSAPKQYIFYVAPSWALVDKLGEELNIFLASNPGLSSAVIRRHRKPLDIFFSNDSVIAAKVGTRLSLRGMSADRLLVDLPDFMDQETVNSLSLIERGDKYRGAIPALFSGGCQKKKTPYLNRYLSRLMPLPGEAPPDPKDRVILYPLTVNPDFSPEEVEDIEKCYEINPEDYAVEWLLEPVLQAIQERHS